MSCFPIKENRRWSKNQSVFGSHLKQYCLHNEILRSTTLILTKTADQTHKCVSSALPTYSQLGLDRESKHQFRTFKANMQLKGSQKLTLQHERARCRA